MRLADSTLVGPVVCLQCDEEVTGNFQRSSSRLCLSPPGRRRRAGPASRRSSAGALASPGPRAHNPAAFRSHGMAARLPPRGNKYKAFLHRQPASFKPPTDTALAGGVQSAGSAGHQAGASRLGCAARGCRKGGGGGWGGGVQLPVSRERTMHLSPSE